MDLIRVRWLEGRVEAGQGRRVQAAAAFTQVRTEFAARGMGFDAALATLDLAVNMGRIFKTKGIGREALAAFSLFCDAARQEIETARRSGRS